MGDSSVSCVLTGVTLTYDPVVLIALAPARFSHHSRKVPAFNRGARVVSNEGPAAYFDPVLLPIFGNMDSYGHVTNIERNEHTAFLEARLGMTIDQIADAIVDGDQPPAMKKFARQVARDSNASPYKKHLIWDGSLYGCFIAREAWDKFSAAFIDEWGKPSYSVWDESGLSAFVLRGLGFVKGPKDLARARSLLGPGEQAGDRYHTPYTHPKVPDVVVWCDMSMASRVTVGNTDLSKEASIYRPVQLQAALRKHNRRLPKAAIAWAKATPGVRVELQEARRSRNAILKRRRQDLERSEAEPSLAFRLIADTTPDDIRESNNKIQSERMSAFMEELFSERKRKRAAAPQAAEPTEQLKLPRPPEVALKVPEGAVQTFCDGYKHLSLTATADGKASLPVVCDCDRGTACTSPDRYSRTIHHVNLPFTPEVVAALRAHGWKARHARETSGFSEAPIMRCVAPELHRIYRGSLLREYLPLMEALVTMVQTMNAANRLWQPTNTGYQYGHLHIQRQVAEFASRVLTRRINQQRRW